jgi:hypothetical protein
VFRPVIKGFGLAFSPQGRKMIRSAVAVARSEEARKVVAQARKVAATPEGRRLAGDAARVASHAGKALRTPEVRDRIRAAARLLAERRR